MNIPMKYEDVVANLETERARVTDYIAQRAQAELKLEAALVREADLIASANQNKLMMDAACGEIATLQEELAEFELVQQRLTVAEQRVGELLAILQGWLDLFPAKGVTGGPLTKQKENTEVAISDLRYPKHSW